MWEHKGKWNLICLLFSKPNELSSAIMYKSESVLSLRGEEARGSNNMVWHELCCGEPGSCLSPREGHLTSQGFLELQMQKA